MSDRHSSLGPTPAKRALLAGLIFVAAVCVAVLAAMFLRPPGRTSDMPEKAPPIEPVRDTADAELSPPKTQPPDAEPTDVEPMDIEAMEKETLDTVGRLVAKFPSDPDPLLLMGTMHAMLGNTDRAANCWKRCLEIEPAHAGACYQMAQLAEKSEEYEEAAQWWRKLLAGNPDLAEIRPKLAATLIDSGKMNEAITLLKEEIDLLPRASGETYTLLAKAHFQLRDYDKAREFYVKAVEVDPGNKGAWYGLATAHARLGNREDSRQAMEKFRTLEAAETSAAEEDVQTIDTAVPAKDAAVVTSYHVQAFERLVMAHMRAAAIYQAEGHSDEAAKHWRRVAELAPRNVACRMRLAKLYLGDGENEKALAVCKQLVEIAPHKAMYRANLGLVYAEMSQIDAALAEMQRAVDIEPENEQYIQARRRIQEKKKLGSRK